MTLVLTTNVVGQPRGEPVRLSGRRRRLSTVVARHRPPAGRRFIVSVHRRGQASEAYPPSDRTVRLRASWPKTLVGPGDVVVITLTPLGKGVASIGLAIASIALIALAPYAAPAIAGAAVFGAGAGAAAGGLTIAIQAGMVVGGLALGYAAQASKAAAKRANGDLYSVSGGGNVPKPGARKPLLYGRRWTSPPLSQPDYFTIDGDANVLTKRMTLGLGKFQIHRIRVGDALFWNEASGIQAPFNAVTGPQGAVVEFLYEQPSAIVPGDIIPSPSVGGQELPRPGGNPARTPWYRLAPQGVSVDAAQFNWTYPAIYRVSSSGKSGGAPAGVVFFGREIDPNTGNVIGPEFEMWRSQEPGEAYIRTPLRRNAYFRLPKSGAYEVSAQNLYPEPLPGVEIENRVVWDGMFAFEDDTRVRPQTTEIVLRVRAGKGLTVTAFGDISVEATRILPVWDGSAWVEQPTRKAVWAFCDLVRNSYGLDAPDGVDADKALYYGDLLAANDTYDGQLPEVSSFWEAASEVLHPLRADPVKVGAVHSFVRDESRAEPRHVLTRRQIVRDSSGASYSTKVEGGDVIVEFDRDGDPRRPDEARFSYGPPTRTPKRYRVAGITDGLHALKHATWLAAVSVFRGVERKVTTEWDGRLVYPGDHILSDLWFLKGKQTYGVASRAGTVLQLDTVANVPVEWGYGSVRTRVGREWGILRMRGVGPRGLELHPDDVAALRVQTGLGLGDVLARDTQDPTTIVLGDLVELQETYVARAALPSDADHVQIEMVQDDPRVWQLLDETVIAPAPVNADSLAEPLVPQISVLHARCVRIETGIEVVWGVSATRGARNYEADLSYDAATWETLSPFGPESSGRAAMRQVDGPVTVRARAYGRTGLPGPWITATFTTVAPIVRSEYVEGLEDLFAGVREEIDRVNAIGAEALAQAGQLAERELRAGMAILLDVNRQLNVRLEEFAQAAATEAGAAYEARQFNKVAAEGRAQDNFAALERVDKLRISDKEAFAGVTTTLGARLTNAEGNIVGNAAALQSLTTTVTNVDGRVTSTSQSVTSLTSRVQNTETGVSGNAIATSQLTTRVSQTEGGISSLSQSYTALQAEVTGPNGRVSGQATAISNLSARVTQTEAGVSSVTEYAITLNSILSGQSGQIAGQATATQLLTSRVSANEAGISSVTRFAIDLQSIISGVGGQVNAQANAISSLTATTSNIDGRVSSQAQSLSVLSTTQNGHTATLTQYGSSIDGISVQWGVAFDLDGNGGGLVFTGMRQLNGAAAYTLRLRGDLIVDGSITGRTLSAQNLITQSAQIGNLIVGNIQIADGAVSQIVAAGSGGTSASVGIGVRGSARLEVKAYFNGNSNGGSTNGPGQLIIQRDGQNISIVNASFALFKPDSGNIQYYLSSMATVAIDQPGGGYHTYTAVHTNGQGVGGVTIVVTELSK
ncbi:host specificity factor TipJ family phage tail protein [Methylobacterium sp. Leaf100]|uniref:host specificity factor TipJ family phage tail protein n=1 Tax=Methylobacterium sp. Leaf100 TaxID=1736252 RepID=UPI0006FB26F2|nr:host specificity factor TipJ family phage tail protein [Methylobacterium sp. Leaf100]KQP36703.1 hypothetical protein ASF25_01740 [Methylobacterium sp. Leaf100]